MQKRLIILTVFQNPKSILKKGFGNLPLQQPFKGLIVQFSIKKEWSHNSENLKKKRKVFRAEVKVIAISAQKRA